MALIPLLIDSSKFLISLLPLRLSLLFIFELKFPLTVGWSPSDVVDKCELEFDS